MLRWSLPIGSILGIHLRLHWTFLAFIGWLGYEGWQDSGWLGAGALVGIMLTLFFCVLLHELGHSIPAMRYGVRVPSITLLPIGGVASMSAIPENPWQEFVIAICGPLVNLVIAVLIGLWVGWWPSLQEIWRVEENPGHFARLIEIMNLRLLMFNLIPAFPMDGGRVFRALLASVMPYGRATFVAAFAGRFIAVLFVIFGNHISVILPLIGVFVFFSAGYENRWVKLRTQLRGRVAADIMKPFAAVVSPDDRLSDVLTLIHRVPQLDFPVFDGAHLVGLLPREVWMEASHLRLDDPPVREIMNTHFTTVRPHIELARLVYDRRALKQSFFPVVDEGRLVGLITRHDLDEAQATAYIPRPMAPHSMPPPLPPRRGLTIDMG